MSNNFSKEERVAFEDILEGFNDALVLSRNVSIYNTDQTMMERTNNVIWRPQPYIAQSFGGSFTLDMTGNFKDYTQMSVPATIGFNRSVPWVMSAVELRDSLQENRLGDAAKQKLASDINLSIMNVAAAQGTLVVPVVGAATGYDNLAACDALMNEQGVQNFDRYAALSSRDYNNMAGNIANGGANRSFASNKSQMAYERAYVGNVAGFETFKMDYANRIAAAAGAGDTIDTSAGGGNIYVPQATSVATTGETSNVDNRFQTVTVNDTTGVVAGDCFTIDGVQAVHHITKQATGALKTFRVIQVVNGTSLVISPPIISGAGGDAAEQYQNVEVVGNAAAPITYRNTGASAINPFWQKDALEILPGRFAVPSDSGAAVMRGATDQGIELVMQKFYDINTMKIKYRLDTLYGVVNKQPEMSGILLFGQ